MIPTQKCRSFMGPRLKQFSSSSSCQTCLPHYVDPRIASKQLSEYLKVGDIRSAEKLFGEIPQRDIVTWSIMIHGYAKCEMHRQSLQMFSSMRDSGLSPNSFAMVGVIGGTVGLRDLVLAQCAHGLVVKYGFESNVIVATALLDSYAKCRNVIDSVKLFEEMDSPGLVSHNALFAGFVHNDLYEEAVRLFIEFLRSGHVPGSLTMLTLIQSCIGLDWWNFSRFVHTLVLKLGLDTDRLVNNACLSMYSSLRDLNSAEKIFHGMESKDAISFSTMMGFLNDLKYTSDAIILFQHMRSCGVKYDYVNIIDLITSCTILGDLQRGREGHAQAIICGYMSELTLLNSLTTMYAKCGELHHSRAIFDQIGQKSVVSWSAIISGCAHGGNPQEAVDFFIRFQAEQQSSFDLVMLVSAVKAAGELALLELCRQLQSLAFRSGFSHYRAIMNSLVSTYSKCGEVKLAQDIFQEMSDSFRNVVSWNAILHGLGINGHGRKALQIFNQMLKSKDEPDDATYLSVLSACSHSGLVKEGLQVYQKMVEEEQVEPDQDHFGCVVDLLARAGKLSDSREFLKRFLEDKMGTKAWKALLNGCLIHGKTKLAEYATEIMVVGSGELKADQIILLSNILVSAGRFQDAEALRSLIDDKRLVKNTAISYLEQNPHNPD